MRKTFRRFLICMIPVIMLLCMAVSATAEKEITIYTKCGTHGTAKRLNGRTAIVSIYASDEKVKWDFESEKDLTRYRNTYKYLGIAAQWIMDQAAQYDVQCELVWDWHRYSSLCWYHAFSGNKVSITDYGYAEYIEYIDTQIPTDDILRELDADSILYLFFYNTPKKNPVGSYALPSGELEYYVCGFEFVCLFTGEFNQETTPGTYAHEILHLFGVPDIYKANDSYNMSAKFIKAYKKKYPRDIMAGASTKKYDRVQFTFSPLVAYYAGLTKSCEWVDEWGLRESDYELYGY